MERYKNEIKIMKALCHPTRVAILEILRDGEQCVCHMEAILKLRQAYISQQLMVLRDTGLLQDRRDGWNIFYSVIRPEIYDVLDAAHKMVGPAPLSMGSLSVECTCPNCQERAS